MKTTPRSKLRILAVVLLSAFGGQLQAAGRLDAFESGFEESNDKDTSGESPSRRYRRSGSRSDPYSNSRWDDLGDIFFIGLGAGATHANELAALRERGDPVLPVARVDLGYQWIDSGVEAFDYGAEVGYGFMALEARHTIFMEEAEDETLEFNQLHLLWRMGLARWLEWDLGIGSAWLRGDGSESGASFTSPVRFWPMEWLGVEVRPAWTAFDGVSLTDIDLSMVLRYEQATMRAGYRWIETESDVEGLSGWRVGLGWRF